MENTGDWAPDAGARPGWRGDCPQNMAGVVVTPEQVRAARYARCHLDDGRPPRTEADAALLVEQRGFLGLGVVRKRPFPNLSQTVDLGEWSISDLAWRSKQTLPAKKACAYLKWIHNQGTFISWRMYPYFYVLFGMRTPPERAYLEGQLSRMEMDVLSLIREHGPLTSQQLWRRLRPKAGKRSELLSALGHLQRVFLVTVSGGETDGWSMHSWDLVQNQVPDGLLDRLPPTEEAVSELVAQAIDNLVYCTPREIASLFRWTPSFASEAARALLAQNRVGFDISIQGQKAQCIRSLFPPVHLPLC